MSGELAGAQVVVTRPAAQSAALAEMVERAGGTVVHLPLLEIEGLPASPAACALLASRPDIIVFVSANAALHGLRLMRDCELALDPQTAVAAVGAATARTLKELGMEQVTVPQERFDTEGLLATELLADVAGKRVLIVRGKDGRELLAKTLRARGAEVAYLASYRRVPLAVDTQAIDTVLATPVRDLAWVITSTEALRQLVAAVPATVRGRLAACAFVLIGERLASTAAELGLAGPLFVAPQMSDEGLLTALRQWRRASRA